MVEFVALTNGSGKAVHVNLGLVEYIAASGGGATLTFTRLKGLASDRLVVRESPEEIVGRARASRI